MRSLAPDLVSRCFSLLDGEDGDALDALSKLFEAYPSEMLDSASSLLPWLVSQCAAEHGEALVAAIEACDAPAEHRVLLRLETFIPGCLQLIGRFVRLYPQLFPVDQLFEAILQTLVAVKNRCVVEAAHLLAAFARLCGRGSEAHFRALLEIVLAGMARGVEETVAAAFARALAAILEVHTTAFVPDLAEFVRVCAGVMAGLPYSCGVHEALAGIVVDIVEDCADEAVLLLVRTEFARFYESDDWRSRGIAMAVFGAIVARTAAVFPRECVEQFVVAAVAEIAAQSAERAADSAAFLCCCCANYAGLIAGEVAAVVIERASIERHREEMEAKAACEALVALFCALELCTGESMLSEEAVEFVMAFVPLRVQVPLNRYVYMLLVRRIGEFRESRVFQRMYAMIRGPVTGSRDELLQLGIPPSVVFEMKRLVEEYER
jgi:hypothetical protein